MLIVVLLFCKGFLFLFPYNTKVIILFYSANILADFLQKKIPAQDHHGGRGNTKERYGIRKLTERYIVNYAQT